MFQRTAQGVPFFAYGIFLGMVGWCLCCHLGECGKVRGKEGGRGWGAKSKYRYAIKTSK